jgi:hypothetical protein
VTYQADESEVVTEETPPHFRIAIGGNFTLSRREVELEAESFIPITIGFHKCGESNINRVKAGGSDGFSTSTENRSMSGTWTSEPKKERVSRTLYSTIRNVVIFCRTRRMDLS